MIIIVVEGACRGISMSRSHAIRVFVHVCVRVYFCPLFTRASAKNKNCSTMKKTNNQNETVVACQQRTTDNKTIPNIVMIIYIMKQTISSCLLAG